MLFHFLLASMLAPSVDNAQDCDSIGLCTQAVSGRRLFACRPNVVLTTLTIPSFPPKMKSRPWSPWREPIHIRGDKPLAPPPSPPPGVGGVWFNPSTYLQS